MRRKPKTYNVYQLASAVLMMLALFWLTISAPFVYASQQELSKQNKSVNVASAMGAEEETSNTFGNTTEEKKPSGSGSFSEEYLHDNHVDGYFFTLSSQYQKCENASDYVAFHGKVQVPPPNFS